QASAWGWLLLISIAIASLPTLKRGKNEKFISRSRPKLRLYAAKAGGVLGTYSELPEVCRTFATAA
ncbi:MAG TPA: hypothetical protein VF251_13500, partial [Pyrinomonadaceae bacterium]